MTIGKQIAAHIAGQREPKRSEMRELDRVIRQVMPGCKLWFLDGRDETGKTVANPNIGYGVHTIKYADGRKKEFYRIGLSANTTGISVYIMGVKDRKYLAATFGGTIGKASVTGYCIKFRTLKDIDTGTLEAAIRFGTGLPDEGAV